MQPGYEALATGPVSSATARPAIITVDEVPRQPSWLRMERACCCLTTGTATAVLGTIDLVHGFAGLIGALLVVVALTHERVVDRTVTAYVDTLIQSNVTLPAPLVDLGFHKNMTAVETAATLARMNKFINHGAKFGLPCIILAAMIALFFGHQGLRAVRDPFAARRYYLWRLVQAVCSIFSGAFLNTLFLGYCALVVRAHCLKLLDQVRANLIPVHVTLNPSFVVSPCHQEPAVVVDHQAKPDAANSNSDLVDVKLADGEP